MSESRFFGLFKNKKRKEEVQGNDVQIKQDAYKDDSDPEKRMQEATKDLQVLLDNVASPHAILEIGTGRGGVTRALQALYGKPIVGIDNDPDPEVQHAAQSNNIRLLQEDMTTITTDRLQDLLRGTTEQPIDTIIALRAPGPVVRHLCKILQEAEFHGNFAFTLVGSEDSEYSIALEWMMKPTVKQMPGEMKFRKQYTMPQGTVGTESGFVIPFT